MNNNDIFKKLRVALQLRDDQIIEILELVDFRISKAELGSFFRNADHPNYMDCGDQVLRNFLNGLVIHLRGTKENPKNPMEVIKSHHPKTNMDLKPKSALLEPKKTFSKSSNGSKPKFFDKNSQTKKPVIVEKVKFKNGKKSQ